MYPRKWSREHKIAWALTGIWGGILGMIASLSLFPTAGRLAIVTLQNADELPADLVISALRFGFLSGALVATLGFYIVKLIAAGPSN